MNKRNATNLLKLADYLEGLPTRLFRFNIWAKDTECGTVGCAVGHLPNVFPRAFAWGPTLFWNDGGTDVLHRKSRAVNGSAAAKFFGLTHDEVDRLFIPGERSIGYSGLREGARPKTVARHIRKFVESKRPDLF